MSDFPVPLDHLISYVRALHPDGDVLERLSDAMEVADRLDEHADALVGYFVDQARSSGASWTQIGASLGVSKQAAQKRFVARDQDLVPEEGQTFSRFTPRARAALATAGELAGDGEVRVSHVIAGSLADPDGLAARAVERLGVSDKQVYEVLGVAHPAAGGDADPAALRQLPFASETRTALRNSLKAALRLEHNYIGTEHLLLGALATSEEVGRRLGEIDLTRELAESAIRIEIAELQLSRRRLRRRGG